VSPPVAPGADATMVAATSAGATCTPSTTGIYRETSRKSRSPPALPAISRSSS
jgi:hypothetical protein